MPDAEYDNVQLPVKTVLTLDVKMSNTGDSYGHMKGNFIGEGTGMFFCDGAGIPIKWSKTAATSPYVFTLENGSELVFGRGATYVCIVAPGYGSVSLE